MLESSWLSNEWIASPQKNDMPGRPGANLIRINEIHEVPRNVLDILDEITTKTEINQNINLLIKEGFIVKDVEHFTLGVFMGNIFT